MPFRHAIFDLDGVLVDTAEFHYRAWKQVADDLGVPFDRVKNERLRGVPRMRSLEIVIEDLPVRPPDLDELAARKNARYVAMVQHLTPADLLPGAGTLLTTLRSHGVRTAVASSSRNARTVIGLLQIDSLLDAVVDGADVAQAKPAPDLFLQAARLLRAEPSSCVVVEDAQAGIDAARAAGMFAVGMERQDPLQGANLRVRQLSEIPVSLWGIGTDPGDPH